MISKNDLQLIVDQLNKEILRLVGYEYASQTEMYCSIDEENPHRVLIHDPAEGYPIDPYATLCGFENIPDNWLDGADYEDPHIYDPFYNCWALLDRFYHPDFQERIRERFNQ